MLKRYGFSMRANVNQDNFQQIGSINLFKLLIRKVYDCSFELGRLI